MKNPTEQVPGEDEKEGKEMIKLQWKVGKCASRPPCLMLSFITSIAHWIPTPLRGTSEFNHR